MGPILGYFNTVSVCLFMMSKSISAETSPLHNVNCPNMLPSISLGIDGQHFHGTKFTTSSTSGKKFLVFPKIPCAYYVDTKRIKYHFKDIIPAFTGGPAINSLPQIYMPCVDSWLRYFFSTRSN